MRLCKTREQTGLLGDLTGLLSMDLHHLPLLLELVLLLASPVQPHPLFAYGMVAL